MVAQYKTLAHTSGSSQQQMMMVMMVTIKWSGLELIVTELPVVEAKHEPLPTTTYHYRYPHHYWPEFFNTEEL